MDRGEWDLEKKMGEWGYGYATLLGGLTLRSVLAGG